MLKEESKYIDLLNEMENELKKLKKQYEAKLAKAKNKASKNCRHNFYSIRKSSCDNGYGNWWTIELKTCKVCGAQDAYNQWPLGDLK